MAEKKRLGTKQLHTMAVKFAEAHGVPVADLVGGNQSPRVVRAREALIGAMHDEGLAFAEIGRQLGMHHTSVITAKRRSDSRRAAYYAMGPIPVPDLSGEWAI